MKRIFFAICLICFTSQVFALDLSKSVNQDGITFNYPSKGYSISKGSIKGDKFISLSKTGMLSFSTLSFQYGKKSKYYTEKDLHTILNEHMESLGELYIEETKVCENFSNEKVYTEDCGTYSMGIVSYSSYFPDHRKKMFGQILIVESSDEVYYIDMVSGKQEEIDVMEEVTKTLRIDGIPDLRISDLYTHYYAFLQQPDSYKKSEAPKPALAENIQNDKVSASTNPSSSKPILAKNSQVDINIPRSNVNNDKTFAIIIANENYQEEASVPYALNDGEVFKNYCETALGIPAKNIHYRPNATLNNIRREINWLNLVCEAYDGQANILFYYAGHGIPDEASKASYLLPIDGTGSDIATGYKLDDLYTALGSMSASRIIVFMDACFSGSKRESGMLASARGVALNAKAGVPKGNMVVFSASQGDETAYPNKDEKHGMFTYYLLKKIQETGGNVNLFDLSSYISTNVRRQAIVINGKSQTPCTTAANELGTEWYNWKLKNSGAFDGK